MVSDVIFDALESIKEYQEAMPNVYKSGGLTQEHVDNLVKHMEDVLKFLDTYNPKIENTTIVGKYSKE